MKNTLLLFVCISFFGNLHAQSYEYAAFPKIHGVWHFTQFSDNWTVVGGVNDEYIFDSTTGLMGGNGGYFEENKKIYNVWNNDTVLKYDFNLTIGDTIIADATFGIDTFYVGQDDSTGYHGRRKITLYALSQYYIPTEWVEGIGNISGYGLLWDNFSAQSISGGYGFWCMFGDSTSIPCTSALGQIKEEKPAAGLTIFPNPATDLISLQPPSSALYQLEIYNKLGQLMKQESIVGQQEYAIPLNGFSAGVYVVILQSKNGVLQQTLLVK